MYNRRARHLQVILDSAALCTQYDGNASSGAMGTDEISFESRSDGWNSGQGSTSRNRSSPGTLVHPALLSCRVQVSERFTATHQQLPLAATHGEATKSVTAVEAPQRGSPECKWPPGIRDLPRLWDRIWSQPRLGGSAEWWLQCKSGVRLQKARPDIKSSLR